MLAFQTCFFASAHQRTLALTMNRTLFSSISTASRAAARQQVRIACRRDAWERKKLIPHDDLGTRRPEDTLLAQQLPMPAQTSLPSS